MEKKQIQVFGLRFRWFRLLLHPFYVDFVQYSEIVFYIPMYHDIAYFFVILLLFA